MTREEIENYIKERMIEIINKVKEYDPDCKYLALDYIENSITCWNDSFQDNRIKPIDFRVVPELLKKMLDWS